MDGASITGMCAGLVVIDQRTNLMNLVHYTTKNYFEQFRSVLFPNFHATITLNCATYLTFEALKDANIWKILQIFLWQDTPPNTLGDHAGQNLEDTLKPFILEILLDETGNTALAVTMERGFEKAVEFLVNSGACVDLTQHPGQEMLLLVADGNWDSVAQVIADKANVERLEVVPSAAQNQTQLVLAAYYGDDKEIQIVIKQANVDRKVKDCDVGTVAFFVAVERGHPKVVDTLLRAGVDVDSKDSTGKTPLHRATRPKSEKLMRLLLNNGLAVDSKNEDGRTAFSANARSCDEFYPKIHLDAGADPSTKGHDGISQLYEAAAKGDVGYVKKLLSCGVNPSTETNYHWTPLHWAAANGHFEVVKLLIQGVVELSPNSEQGSTLLDMAFRANQSFTTSRNL
ncbi:hypothetical protein MMC29_007513 [Sticta canariensis]|nr:hypothetical protein [Sticta canariensis]